MHVYLLTGTSLQEVTRYHATLKEAHELAKACAVTRPDDLTDIRIELLNAITDKAAILRMLNDEGQFIDGGPLRTWRLTPRRGLVECENGE